jgi:hypothetical protein
MRHTPFLYPSMSQVSFRYSLLSSADGFVVFFCPPAAPVNTQHHAASFTARRALQLIFY